MPPRSSRTGRFLRREHGRIESKQRGAAMGALLIPAALIGVGVILWKRQHSSPMSGYGAPYGAFPLAGYGAPYGAFPLAGFGSKFKGAVNKIADNKIVKTIAKIDPGARATQAIVNTARAQGGIGTKLKAAASNFAKVSPSGMVAKHLVGAVKKHSPLYKRFGNRESQAAQPEPGQDIVYQDAMGQVITKGEYDALIQAGTLGQPVFYNGRWAMPDGTFSNVDPNQSPPLVSHDYQIPAANMGPGGGYSSSSYGNNSGGGGGGGSEDYYGQPAAPAEAPAEAAVQQYQQQDTAPAPVAKKFNPLIAIGTLIAVPMVLGLTGHK